MLQGVSDKRQQSSRKLLHDLDSLDKALGSDARLTPWKESERQAYDMILGDGGKVFDLTQENDAMRATLTAPSTAIAEPRKLMLEAEAQIDGKVVRHESFPAEDMTQAFAWHHLVTAEQSMICVFSKEHRKPLWSEFEHRLQIPARKTTQLRFAIPLGQAANQIQLALSDPPDGIGIANVNQSGGFLTVRFSADSKAKPSMAGNLIVEATALKPTDGSNPQAKPQRPMALGFLPAIPFEVVQP